MEMEFDVKVTAGVLYDYLLYHTYTGLSGMIGTLVGAVLIMTFLSTNYLPDCRRCADRVSSGGAFFESDAAGAEHARLQEAPALQNDGGGHQCISGGYRGKTKLG